MGGLPGPALASRPIISGLPVTAVLAEAAQAARLGAVAFMVSDSLVAVDKFAQPGVPTG
jgi:hypothetical protein